MLTPTDLFKRWQEADAVARHAEDLLAARLATHIAGKGPIPSQVEVHAVEALREAVEVRRRAAMEALRSPNASPALLN